MILPLGNQRRIDVVTDALQEAVWQMVFRSTRGALLAPRFRVAMYAYNDRVYDLLDGVQTITVLAQRGIPEIDPSGTANARAAFLQAEALLRAELPGMQECPPPLVCHLTDGDFTGADPEQVAKRIMAMRVPDGPVLVENIFISNDVLPELVHDAKVWPGIVPSTRLGNDCGRRLRAMSSPLPEQYREWLSEYGYHLAPGAVMMVPGSNPSMVRLGALLSAVIPTSVS